MTDELQWYSPKAVVRRKSRKAIICIAIDANIRMRILSITVSNDYKIFFQQSIDKSFNHIV